MRRCHYQTTAPTTPTAYTVQHKGAIDVSEPVTVWLEGAVAAHWLLRSCGMHARSSGMSKLREQNVANWSLPLGLAGLPRSPIARIHADHAYRRSREKRDGIRTR